MTNAQPLYSEDAALVLRALQQSSKPLNLADLRKAMPKAAQIKKARLLELLEQLVKDGRIRVHPARSTVYWLPDHESQAGERVIEALDERPMTETELKNKFRSLLVGWPDAKRKEILARLLKEKRVYKVPALTGRSKLLSVRSEPTAQDYVKLAIQMAVKKLEPLGYTSEQVFAVASELSQQLPPDTREFLIEHEPTDIDQIILERMVQLKPAAENGALVSISELRRSLSTEIPSKTVFDQRVLRLAEEGRVALHHHDFPSSLSQDERDALVPDEFGNYYVGIALRV